MELTPAALARGAIIVAVLLLLARAARIAWQRRALALQVWGAIRPRHVVGAVGLMVVVLAAAITLLAFVPVTSYGLGSLIGLEGNAVFAPVDGALQAPVDAALAGEDAAVPWWQVAGVSGFLLLLTAMFPHLANAEEWAFRAGWERYDETRRAFSALRFGMVHMVMLIPLAAALAISVAGWVYGRIYLRAHARSLASAADDMPMAADVAEAMISGVVSGEVDVAAAVRERRNREAQQAGVLAATVWHTTFNSLIAVIVLVGYLSSL